MISIFCSKSFGKFLDIDKFYSISQNLITIYNNLGIEVLASQIYFITNKIILCISQGFKSKKFRI